MSKILILGAAGFIGKSLTAALAKENQIVAFDRIVAPEFAGNDHITSVVGDYASLKSFDEYLKGVDTVIHLVSTTVPSDDTSHIPEEIMNNVVPTVRLLEDMQRNGVKRILFSSSAGAYYGETGDRINEIDSPSNPYCSYGVQKSVIENYLRFYGRRYGLDYRIVRISNPYGWGQDSRKMQGLIPIFINKILNDEPISVYGQGDNRRDYLFMEDLICALTKVVNYEGSCNTFNLGYGAYYTINEIISFIEEVAGKKFVNVEYQAERFCDVKSSLVNMAAAQEELDWHPKTDIMTGIKAAFEHISKNCSQN